MTPDRRVFLVPLLLLLAGCRTEPLPGIVPIDGGAAEDLRGGALDLLRRDGTAGCGDPAVAARFAACQGARNEAACRAAGGSWRRIGLSLDPECVCPTGQDGCRCTRGADCLGACVAPIEGGGVGADPCRELAAGACTGSAPVVGCWCFFGSFGSPEGVAQGLCVD